jgi:hypothetical protein
MSESKRSGGGTADRTSRQRACKQLAHLKPNPNQLAFQWTLPAVPPGTGAGGRDHLRCVGAAREPAEEDSPVAVHRNGFDGAASVRGDTRGRPSPAEVTSRRGEIARRYKREEPGAATWKEISPNKRRKELRVLRRLLAEAGQFTAQLDAVIADGGAPEMNAREIAARYCFAFVFDHYKQIGAATRRHPSTLRPTDATKAEIEAYLKAFHRPRKAAARHKRYAERRATEAAQREQADNLDCRSSAILTVLTDTPQPISRIMKAVARSNAFRARDGKRFLTGDSLSKAIRRELEKPVLAALIEV